MRSLIFAAAAATTLGTGLPASAQTVYVDDGYRGYRGEYSDWSRPRVRIDVDAPRARVYAYDGAPRYRSRSYDRDWNGGSYAYDAAPRYRSRGGDWDDGYGAYAYHEGPYIRHNWGGPSVSVGVGYGWDDGYGDRSGGWRW